MGKSSNVTADRLWFPSARQAPGEVLAHLRSMDPSIELHWLRRGEWALGGYKPNAHRRKQSERTLAVLESCGRTLDANFRDVSEFRAAIVAWGDKMAYERLKLQGFVHHMTFPGWLCEFGIMETWLREALWTKQHVYEWGMREMEASLEKNPEAESRAKDLTDRSRLREGWRMGFKNPKSVVSAGIPGAPPRRRILDPFTGRVAV